jgi:hypothetical protein
VNARERKTLTTRGRKIGYWRPELSDIIETLLQITATIDPSSGVTPDRPTIEWPDEVAPSLQDTAQAIQVLRAAEAMSQQTAIEMAHPDWDEPRVLEELKRITAEQAATAELHQSPDPHTFTGDQPAHLPEQ